MKKVHSISSHEAANSSGSNSARQLSNVSMRADPGRHRAGQPVWPVWISTHHDQVAGSELALREKLFARTQVATIG
jgi:hypothetical protein